MSVSAILEGLNDKEENLRDPFPKGGEPSELYYIDIYPTYGYRRASFDTYEKAEKFAINFLKDYKNYSHPPIPNSHRRAEIVYQGDVLKVINYDDVVNESVKDDDDYNDKVALTTADLKLLKDVEDYAKRIAKWAASVKKAGDTSTALRYAFGDCKRHLEEDLKNITDTTMDMK